MAKKVVDTKTEKKYGKKVVDTKTDGLALLLGTKLKNWKHVSFYSCLNLMNIEFPVFS